MSSMPLTLKNSFSMDAAPAAAWAVLTDIERAAPCFPGAQLQGQAEDGTWRAHFAVKLGPMAFLFAGRFHIAEADQAQGRVVVKGQGSDTKGRGGAKAEVQVHLKPGPNGGGTQIDIASAVDLSGSLAQFGRGTGMIDALSRQLVEQFAANLRAASLADGPMATEPPGGPSPADDPPAAPPTLDAGSLMWSAWKQGLRRWLAIIFRR